MLEKTIFNTLQNGQQIQTFIALLNCCEAEGVTDIRFVRQRLGEMLHRNAPRMMMTPEQRQQARERKKILASIKPLIIDKGVEIARCPSCATGVLKQVEREGVIYVACVRNRRYGCGYSQVIG